MQQLGADGVAGCSWEEWRDGMMSEPSLLQLFQIGVDDDGEQGESLSLLPEEGLTKRESTNLDTEEKCKCLCCVIQ